MNANDKTVHPYIRQGDLLFVPVPEIPQGPNERSKPLETRILAAGEATGHHHQIALEDAEAGKAEVYKISYYSAEPDYLRVTAEGGISIVHEEHGTVALSKGNYKIHRAREFDYLSRAARRVRD